MAFNIATFKTAGLTYGGSRPSMFEISLSAPGIFGAGSAAGKVNFMCSASQLPAGTIGSIQVGYFGRKIKVAGDRSFADWKVTILNDEDFSVRSMLESWQNGINALIANARDQALSMEQYKVNGTITHWSKDGVTITRSYAFIGVFPTDVGPINVDWNTQNQTETYDTTFAYDYWVPVVETSLYANGATIAYGSNTDPSTGA